MKKLTVLAILALFLVAIRADEEVLDEEIDPLVNMLQSMTSMSKFRRDVDSFFQPLLKNIENKERREEDVADFLFAMFDHNNDGFIDEREMHFLFKEMNATSAEQKQIVRYIDRDRDNRLTKAVELTCRRERSEKPGVDGSEEYLAIHVKMAALNVDVREYTISTDEI